MLFWMWVFDRGPDEPMGVTTLADREDMWDPDYAFQPRHAQGPRTTVTYEGVTYPAIDFGDNSYLVLGCTSCPAPQFSHELPPAPYIGNRKADDAARDLHGKLCSLKKFREWAEAHEAKHLVSQPSLKSSSGARTRLTKPTASRD